MTMRVEVRIHFGEKNYSLNREVENHFPNYQEDIVKFVRETLTEVIADIERLEGNGTPS